MNCLSRDNDYLYLIQGDPFYYYTGTTTDGFQALVVLYYPSTITILFDKGGNLVDTLERPLPESARATVEDYGFYEAFLQGADREIISHLEETGFRQGPITVKRFSTPHYHIGITDFPDSFCDTLLRPSCYSVDDRIVAENELKRWSSEGLFELWLNQDSYRWIDRTGKVQAS